mgnify:FL=1|jgi:hypothetical protein|tara:strand:+ start:1657 stop:1863 length:207 start_codon:yes stop_codon:yes gene_type:complete
MRVDVVRKRLSREVPDEEVVFVIDNNTSDYYEVINEPFLHAGPSKFIDDATKEPFHKSVVIVRLRKKK